MSRSNPYTNEYSILTTLPTLKACIFSFLIRQKAIEIEIAFFNFLGNPKGHTLDNFFYASHIRHNFPYKQIPISMS